MSYVSQTIAETTEVREKASDKAFENGRVYEIKYLRYWLFYKPLELILHIYFATFRFEISPEEEKILRDRSQPRIYAIWHNRSLLCAAWMYRFNIAVNTASLISPSKMAAWQAAFFKRLGYTVIRGSSTRRSIQSTRELLKAHSNGEDIGIAPDGPSGPMYSIQRGIVALARRTDSPIVFTTANTKSAWRPDTWDRHVFPLPFSKIQLRVARIAPYSEMKFQSEEAAKAHYNRTFLAINEDPFKMPE